MKELKLIFKIAPKKLFYGFLSRRHAEKAVMYKGRFYAVEYHRNLAHYYYFKAFGEEPKL